MRLVNNNHYIVVPPLGFYPTALPNNERDLLTHFSTPYFSSGIISPCRNPPDTLEIMDIHAPGELTLLPNPSSYVVRRYEVPSEVELIANNIKLFFLNRITLLRT